MPDAPEPDAGPGRHPRPATMAVIVRDVIAVAAPDELPLAEALNRAGGRAARRLIRRRRPREPLGFGLGEVAVLATPVVWIAVDEAVRRSVDDTLSGVLRRLGRRRRQPGPATAVPPLTPGQLAHVRGRVLELAAQAGLDGERAGVLADRVVARLALEQGPGGPVADGPPGGGPPSGGSPPGGGTGGGGTAGGGTAGSPPPGGATGTVSPAAPGAATPGLPGRDPGSPHTDATGTAETTLRFVLLVCLLLAASASMAASLIADPSLSPWAGTTAGTLGCLLAAGADPAAGLTGTELPVTRYPAAFARCTTRYGGTGPLSPWPPALAVAILLAVAALVYWRWPAWRTRHRRLIPVAEADPSGALQQVLTGLAVSAGLARPPRFVIDPTARSASAVVFGRPRAYTVALHAGLLPRLRTDPAVFHAVVLHELAHLRDRDVGITYAAVWLWRLYLFGLLLPYVTVTALDLAHPFQGPSAVFAAPERFIDARDLGLAVLLAVLVYLVRADLLCARELLADRTAVLLGADPACWGPGPPGSHGRAAGARSFLTGLWGTHPPWQQRRRAIAEPGVFHPAPTRQFVLTGASAAIVTSLLPSLAPRSTGLQDLATWCAGGLAAAIITVAMWRAAPLTRRTAARGLWPGLCLGAGLAVTDAVIWPGNFTLPVRPLFVLPLAVTGVAVVQWAAEYAQPPASRPDRRDRRLGMLVTLAVAWLVLGAALEWWWAGGGYFANGLPLSAPAEMRSLLGGSPPAVPGGQTAFAAITAAVSVTGIAAFPLLLAALALWLPQGLSWARHRHPLPGRLALAAAGGGAAGCAFAVMVTLYLHARRVPADRRSGDFALLYLALLTVALAAGALIAGVAAAVPARHSRLLSALAAAGGSLVIGACGVFLLATTDGCAGPLSTLAYSCSWRPAAGWAIVSTVWPYAIGLGVAAAAVAALPAAVAGAVARRAARHVGLARHDPELAVRDAARRARWRPATLRAGATLACLLATALSCGSWLTTSAVQRAPGTAAPMLTAGILPPAPRAVLKWQLAAWFHVGGSALVAATGSDARKLADATAHLAAALGRSPEPATFRRADAPLRQACLGIASGARQAEAYFPVPGSPGGRLWSAMLADARKAASDCLAGVRLASQAKIVAALVETRAMLDSAAGLLRLLRTELLTPGVVGLPAGRRTGNPAG